MTELDERAVSHALRVLVEPSPTVDLGVPGDLADRVEHRYRQHRRRRRSGLATTVVAAGVVVAIGLAHTSAPATPVAGADTSATRPGAAPYASAVIRSGRYVETMTLGRDAAGPSEANAAGLIIAPPPAGAPLVSEAAAVQLFRSSGLADSRGQPEYVHDVQVGFGTVTVGPELRTGTAAWFVNRPAWVVTYAELASACPGTESAPATTLATGRLYYLLDATTGTRAVLYRDAASTCGNPLTVPTVTPVVEHVSLPWQELSRAPGSITVQYRQSGCMDALTGVVTGQVLSIDASYLLDGASCTTVTATLTVAGLIDPQAGLEHAPTGPIENIRTATSGTDFGYDAGR